MLRGESIDMYAAACFELCLGSRVEQIRDKSQRLVRLSAVNDTLVARATSRSNYLKDELLFMSIAVLLQYCAIVGETPCLRSIRLSLLACH